MTTGKVVEINEIKNGVIPASLVDAGEPVVMRGLVSHWPVVAAALNSQSSVFEYINKFSNELPVVIYSSTEGLNKKIGYLDDYTGFNFQRESSTLKAVLDQLNEPLNKTLYIGSTRVDRWLPGFREENDLVFAGQKPVVNFWMGNQNKVSAHFDTPDNIACCVAGKRTFTLFPPEQIENLYIGPIDLTPSGRAISLVDFNAPDFEKFPKFKQALEHQIVIELVPGDALYLPPLWWHHVQSHANFNMLINYWWQRAPAFRGVPDLALEHGILAIRGLPESQRRAWKALFDYYVFDAPEKAVEHIPPAIRGMLNSEDERAIQLGWFNFSKKLNS